MHCAICRGAAPVCNSEKNSKVLCCVLKVSLVAGLVMWDEVAATKDWVESQLPDILKVRVLS